MSREAIFTQLLTVYAIGSPVLYAILAGRASQNLIETEVWHRWSFRFFCAGMVGVFALWWSVMPGFHCD